MMYATYESVARCQMAMASRNDLSYLCSLPTSGMSRAATDERAMTFATNDVNLSIYVPGTVGRVTGRHASYHHQHRDFDLWFEAKVAAAPDYRSSSHETENNHRGGTVTGLAVRASPSGQAPGDLCVTRVTC